MSNYFHKDKLTRVDISGKGEKIMANIDMCPTQNHEINDQLLKLEKEFAADIYFWKDRTRWL